MISDDKLIEQFERDKTEAHGALAKQYENTEECQEFYNGDFMSYRDRLYRGFDTQPSKKVIVQFNKIKPYVNAVKGWLAQNRRKAKYLARITDSEMRLQFSEHANAYASYVRENSNADQYETQQDGDMLINGYGAIETALSFDEGHATTDPAGEVLKGRLDPMSVFWDASAREPNLMDRGYCGYKAEYGLDDALDLFDGSSEEDFEESGPEDGMDVYMRNVQYDVDWSNRTRNMINVYFYQWMEYEDFWRCDNPLFTATMPDQAMFIQMRLDQIAAMGDEDSLFSMDMRAQILNCNAEQKRAITELMDGNVEFVKFKRKAFFGAVISGKKVFSKYRLISQQGFTIQFKTGDWDDTRKMWVGMVNSMKDPVLYYNRALTELLYTIAAGAKGGLIYEAGAIDKIREFEANYNKTDGLAEVAEGAISGGRIKDKRQPYQPTGLDQLITISDGAIADVTGLDPTFLGNSENKLETASLQRQRIKQITSVLACYVDSISLYQKLDARLLLDIMRIMAKANPATMIRVTGDDGSTDLEQVDLDALFAEYDVSIEESQQTPEEREERAKILINMGTALLSAGDASGKLLYAMALDDLDIDGEKKVKAMQALMPDEKIDPAYVKQLEAALEQAQGEQAQVALRKIVSETMLNMAKVDKTHAEIDGEVEGVHNTAADTVKKLEESRKIAAETDFVTKADSVSVTV